MANSCVALRTTLAAQTPVYDEIFLQDYKPLDSAVMGRHLTEVWKLGTGDTHISDRIEIGQPNLQDNWQAISATECDTNSPCNPPRTDVAFGTTRTQHGMHQKVLQSQLFCLTQLRYNTRPSEQIARIMQGLKKIPEMYVSDFLQVEAFKGMPTVQIADSDFSTFVPDVTGPVTNITGMLNTINLGSTGALPESQLTFPYLNYLTTNLQMQGYFQAGSGLAMGMYNLITDARSWFKLTNGMDSMKDMMALTDTDEASQLYKIGYGIQKPFGNIAPTLNNMPIRFQHMGNGVLNRVQEYYNEATTTGIRRVVNPAYINARYQLSWIWHPKAVKLFTPEFKKINEKVPSVNSAMYGQWQFINNQGLLQYTMPDGTVCTKNNDLQDWFYWVARLENGVQLLYPEMLMPILHLVDGSGKDSTVNAPVCGDAPAYVAQSYGDLPLVCEA